MFYQCVTIAVRIYNIHSAVNTNDAEYVAKGLVLPHIKILYNIVVLLVVLIGLPIINDTVLEIIGDAKYIIKQILGKKKE